jgi:chemotaxis protein MotB
METSSGEGWRDGHQTKDPEDDMHSLKLTRPAMASVFLFLLLLPGCVKSSTYQRAQDELAQARRGQEEISARMAAELARRDERETRLRDQMTTLQREMDRLIEDLGTARRELLVAQEDLAASQVEASRLANLLSAQGAEAQRLRGRLDQLSSIEQEIRERNRIYEDVLGRFRSLIDAGRLSVSISRGRLVINLPQDILFGSGSATLGRDGRQTVVEVASVLAEIEDRRFQVEGHTDNVPISTAQFPSNWELSAARALSVVKILVEQGVAPDNVSGAGYGEYHPVATNTTPDGRRLNRRIEIVMLPNLDVIAESGVGG